MSIRLKPTQIIAGIVAGALLAGGGYALAASRPRTIHGCVSRKSHVLVIKARCGKGYTSLTWNQRGVKGARGATGRAGQSGASATVSVGTVNTGTSAAVTNSGSGSNAVLNFTLPSPTGGDNYAYGEVWPGAKDTGAPAPVVERGSSNVAGAENGGGVGMYVVFVSGCSAAGLEEPVITVTGNADFSDSNNTAGASIIANVVGWQTATINPYDGDLAFNVQTVDLATGDPIDSDFAFTVDC